jgi:hypothetical protein
MWIDSETLSGCCGFRGIMRVFVDLKVQRTGHRDWGVRILDVQLLPFMGVFGKRLASRFLPNKTFPIRNLLFIPSGILAISTDTFCQPLHPLEKYPLQSHFFNRTQQVKYGR